MPFAQECRRNGLNPKEVLEGSLRNAFKDSYANTFMQEIYEAFWAKAEGGSDQFGEMWAPLASSTIGLKKQMAGEVPGEESEFQKHRKDKSKNGLIHYTVTAVPQIQGLYSHRKQLSPSQRAVYDQAARGVHRSSADRRGLAAVRHTPDPEKASLINVRSGRLAAALAPVTASRGRLYQSGPDTVYSWGTYYGYPALKIDINVPYVDQVHYGDEHTPPRPVIPSVRNTKVVHEEAIRNGVQAAKRIADIQDIGRL